jgi:hypothetical protein
MLIGIWRRVAVWKAEQEQGGSSQKKRVLRALTACSAGRDVEMVTSPRSSRAKIRCDNHYRIEI